MPQPRMRYFTPFHLDTGAERLWQGTEPVRLRQKPLGCGESGRGYVNTLIITSQVAERLLALAESVQHETALRLP